MLWDYAPWILGAVQIRQIKAGMHRMSVRSMSSLRQFVCLVCFHLFGYLFEGLVCFSFCLLFLTAYAQSLLGSYFFFKLVKIYFE